MGAQRIEWIDCARGLGIILVVMGHTMTMIGIIPIHYIIFSFHMPLFVFLTTMLMKEHPWKAVAASKARSLLVPYLTYLALVGLPILVWETVHAPMAGAKFLMRLVLGGNFLYGVFAAYWYVPAIYVALVLYAMMQGALGGERTRYFVAGIFVVAMVAQGISALNIGMPIPYALHTVPALIVFIWLGRMVPWSSRPRLLTVMALVIVTGAIALDMVTGRPHFDMDIKRGALGAPIIGLLVAFAGSQLIFDLARILSRVGISNAIFGYVGRVTLPILFLHQAVHFFLEYMKSVNEVIIFLTSLTAPIVLATVLSWMRARKVGCRDLVREKEI